MLTPVTESALDQAGDGGAREPFFKLLRGDEVIDESLHTGDSGVREPFSM